MRAARLAAFIRLVRLHNVVVAVLNGLVGVLTVAWLLGSPVDWKAGGAALAAIALIAAGGYAINDYFDADIDAIDKPYRPIPSGLVKPYEAYTLSITLFTTGVVASIVPGLYTLIYAVIVAVLLYAYPALLKRRRALCGHLTVAFTGASTIPFAALAVAPNPLDALAAVAAPTLFAFTLILAREFVKALEDLPGDSRRGAATIATRYGVGVAKAAAAATLALVAVASPAPYLLGPYTLAYMAPASLVALLCAYSVILVARGAYPRARRLLKVAFGLGALAFLADPLLNTLYYHQG